MPRRLMVLVLLVQVAALWPVWAWVAGRLAASPGEGAGLLALVVAGIVLWRAAPAAPPPAPLLLPTPLMLAYAAAVPFAPPLVAAIFGVAALVATASAVRMGTRLHLGLCGLALLALPVLPSLHFFLGYPLRAGVAQAAAPLLRGTGYPVLAEGACLRWHGTLVAIDAPCSGVNMLWTGLVLALALAAWLRLSALRTLAALGLALLAVLAGNILRVTALFYPEAGLLHLPPWGHAGIGVVTFVLAAGVITWGVLCLEGKGPCAPSSSS